MTQTSTSTVPADGPATEAMSRDQVLSKIRSGRRLEKIAESIESFLDNQVARLEKAMLECESAAENDRIVQSILASFEKEKLAWEEMRQLEIARLSRAGEELIKGWASLEAEQIKWLDARGATDN